MKQNFVVFLLLITIFFTLNCCKKQTFLKHKTSFELKNAPWGVEFNALIPHIDKYPEELGKVSTARIDSLLASAASLGIKWVRLSVNWSNIVDTSGNYHWQKIDQIVEGLLANKIEIALCINGGHLKYTQSRAPESPEEIAMWKEFAGQMVKRYKGKVRHWELWNEPNTVWFWKPRPKAEKYFALMKEFHALVAEIDPNSEIIGGSLARLDLVYADSLLRLGIGDYIDAISYHPYNEFPEAILNPLRLPVKTPVWYTEADHSIFKLKEMVDSVNSGIRLWQAECGYPSQDNCSGWMGNGPWSPTIQAKWLLRRMLVDLSYNAEVISYFCLVEYSTSAKVDEGKGIINSKGLLSQQKLEQKPAFRAYQNLTSVLHDSLQAEFSERYNIKIINQGSFYGIKSKNIKFLEIQNIKGNHFLAYWIAWRMQDIVANASISVEMNQSLKSPVLINLLSGEVLTLKSDLQGTRQVLSLPLADYPFIIAEARSIEAK
jgi:hypothetical protein